MDINGFIDSLDFAEFAKFFLETRKEEFEIIGMNLAHKFSGTGQVQIPAELLSKICHDVLMEANNMTLITLQLYQTWFISKLLEADA